MRARLFVVVAGALSAASACEPVAPPTAPEPLDQVQLTATPFVTGLDQPIDLARRADGVLYVAERPGRVRALTIVGAQTVLSIPGVPTSGERGLLGLAFSPDGSRLFVAHNVADGDLVVAEYAMVDVLHADPGSRRVLLTVEHRQFSNHNGGGIEVDGAGRLYVATGDGGGGGDPNGNAQRLDSLAGKILRIDPRPSGGRAYTIPPDNPFVNTPGAAPEIWAYGLRNPWRFSFDSATGDLWIGDVGQARREEVDFDRVPLTGGRNYGWNAFEGTLPFGGPVPGPVVGPLLDYPSDSGRDCSITGGTVVRSTQPNLIGLDGAYLYADFCSGRIGALRQRDGQLVEHVGALATVSNPVAFEVSRGEAFVVSIAGSVLRLTAS